MKHNSPGLLIEEKPKAPKKISTFPNFSIKDIPILSFFTGAGFLDLGFSNAGFEIVWHNEFCADFAKGFDHSRETLSRNERIENTSSIIDVGPKQILSEAFGVSGTPQTFGVIGGPPCPDFSVGGKNRGREGEQGRLSQVYVNRIIELQPSFFLFENVPGLLRTKKHRHFLMSLLSRLSFYYEIDVAMLNALDFAVPQDRFRVFIIGFNRKWLKNNGAGICSALTSAAFSEMCEEAVPMRRWFPWDCLKKYNDAKKSFVWPGVVPLGEVPDFPHGLPLELMAGPLICDFEETSALPNGLDYFNPYSPRFTEIREGDVSRKSYKRLHRWRYSPTVAYGNNEVHLHPVFNRRLSVREALRLQTVPDQFAFPAGMTLSKKFKAIGNGVPVKLAESVARTIGLLLEGGI